jgi:hypothetical protein
VVRRGWGWAGAAAIVGAASAFAISAGAARSAGSPPAFAGAITACSDTVGSVVAVDFAGAKVAPYGVSDKWGGPVALGCDTSDPAHGIDLLTDTGFTTAGDQHDGPQFLCRIGSPLFNGGAHYPTPAQDPCVVTPPASAYWSFWLAPAGQDTWTYSPLGASSDVPQPGEVEAWTFGGTDIAGTTGQPSFTPAQVRAQEAAVPTTITSTTATTTTQATTTPTSSTGASPTSTRTTQTTTAATTTTAGGTPTARGSGGSVSPARLNQAARYLATTRGANGLSGGTSLARQGLYESAPRFADFGLTIDGAFALAAAHRQSSALHRVLAFIAHGHDGSHRTINTWTEIGTREANGGSVGKEALLAEVAGADPRHFAGHDLVAALDALICTHRAKGACAGGPGSLRHGASTFDQALAIMAELRAGDRVHARPAIRYLQRLQHSSGAWPSIIPSSGDSDVDSSAMAAMALALVPGSATAARDEQRGIAWIASRQERDGGFPGAAGDSTNSAALAIQAMSLDGSRYAAQLRRARAFLLGEQNGDGGFAIAATGSRASDVRASTQVLGGLIGTSFGTLTAG